MACRIHDRVHTVRDVAQKPHALLRVQGARDGVLLVLLDLSASFDTVDHNILIDRLDHRCGVTGTVHDWIRSYLSGRTQRVRIGEAHSEPTEPTN